MRSEPVCKYLQEKPSLLVSGEVVTEMDAASLCLAGFVNGSCAVFLFTGSFASDSRLLHGSGKSGLSFSIRFSSAKVTNSGTQESLMDFRESTEMAAVDFPLPTSQ